jgi:hypothetical protein
MSPLIDCFRKIYVFLVIPSLKNKSVQTDSKSESTTKSSQTQTQTQTSIDEAIPIRYIDSYAQTDIKLADICNDNEWSNLTWTRTDLIDMV